MNTRGYLQTGQITCHDTLGREIFCKGSGQDAEFGKGVPWPSPRFEEKGDVVLDHLTGLTWTQNANPTEFPLKWQEALDYISNLNSKGTFGYSDWRLPNRQELRSLISYQTKKPALPEGHPLSDLPCRSKINRKLLFSVNTQKLVHHLMMVGGDSACPPANCRRG